TRTDGRGAVERSHRVEDRRHAPRRGKAREEHLPEASVAAGGDGSSSRPRRAPIPRSALSSYTAYCTRSNGQSDLSQPSTACRSGTSSSARLARTHDVTWMSCASSRDGYM